MRATATAERQPTQRQTPQEKALAEAMAAGVRQAVIDAIVRNGREMPGDRPALTVERAPVAIAPAQLALAHPAGKPRDEAQQLYERCLAYYRGTVRAQDEARGIDDVGAAVAAFVGANLCALQGGTVTLPLLLKLEHQLAGIVRLSADWDSAPARDRQAYFEQMAVIAVLITETAAQAARQGQVAVANVQRAARGYLQQLLGIDPDDLVIGPDGLAARQGS